MKPETTVTFEVFPSDWLLLVRLPVVARSEHAPTQRPEIRLQSDSPDDARNQRGPAATSLRARQGPSAASGGALRAALTRPARGGLMLLCDEGIAFFVTRRPPTGICLHTVECDNGNDL